ncbi:MAG: hypothetical protein OXF74_07195 [Rhodobacteraceae bacterium]|nr:hypothetical protein [Paracoccaceae bacterium]
MTGQTGGRGGIADQLAHPDVFTTLMLLAVAAMPFIPGAWLLTLPASFFYCAWLARHRAHLPFRLPMTAEGQDFNAPEAGGTGRFRRGEGILFLGNAFDSNEEIWISNSDARRHALVLATTGAGKALPDDTLVLTPSGWRRNGGLRPGDKVMHPSGKASRIVSVHPQGRLPIVRLEFADGRMAECSRDHLWRVRLQGGVEKKDGLWKAADIGIALRLGSLSGEGGLRIFIELPKPQQGLRSMPDLTHGTAALAATAGLERLGFMPSLAASVDKRWRWTASFLQARLREPAGGHSNGWVEVPVLGASDGFLLRHLIWSLGGAAMQLRRGTDLSVRFALPGQEALVAGFPPCNRSLIRDGLEIIGAEGFSSDGEAHAARSRIRDMLISGRMRNEEAGRSLAGIRPRRRPMSCIRTDAADGLFVIEGYLPTHNSEFLLGLASQSLMWASGFMFIDGKGTTEFHAKAWSIVSRFGRQDDYRILNFTDAGNGIDLTAGGPDVQSNTLNPFAHGSADQLMNLIVSLMGGTGSEGEMWRNRAMALVTSTMKALCEMRDAGDVLLDVQAIRDFLPLGTGIDRRFAADGPFTEVSQIPDEAWDEMRRRGGLIELYLRALRGEFSEKSRLALKGFFDSLPGFSLEKALNGEKQEGKAVEQHGFLSMQLTKPLGSLADDFGHIFRTPFGEVDIDDVVLNRRVLVVLLPALQKAPDEMRNCGRIVVAMLKMMMGRAAGSMLEGTQAELVERRPTTSPSPFITILDEAGYYMVKGIDTMMAQARSLGFMIIIAGQDMASMQSISPQIAETAAANARLTVAGATEDAQRTWRFLQSKFARHRVAVASAKIQKPGLTGFKWVDRPDRHFIETERVPIAELQKLREGEFYFLMESKLVKARAFHIGECWAPWIAINKFLPVRGPDDHGLNGDRSVDGRFLDALLAAGHSLLQPDEMLKRCGKFHTDPQDSLHCAVKYSEAVYQGMPSGQPPSDRIRDAALLGMIFGTQLRTTGGDD